MRKKKREKRKHPYSIFIRLFISVGVIAASFTFSAFLYAIFRGGWI